VSKASQIRRSRRVIRMVSELHRMGFQRLRFMPYLRECLAYRVLVAPVSCFSVANGCHAKSEFPGVTYSSASENEYFGWTDATSDDAHKLAVKFVDRKLPDMVPDATGPTLAGCLNCWERWKNIRTGCRTCFRRNLENPRRPCGFFRWISTVNKMTHRIQPIGSWPYPCRLPAKTSEPPERRRGPVAIPRLFRPGRPHPQCFRRLQSRISPRRLRVRVGIATMKNRLDAAGIKPAFDPVKVSARFWSIAAEGSDGRAR